jgi:hypothetical protein
MPPRLKVFQAHLGFFDTIVAAPSQKAALEAWGSSQNLFRDGAASVATDGDAVKAALKRPGVVLKRLAGSNGEFVEQPALPGNVARLHARKAAAPKAAKTAKPARPVRDRAKPAPDRGKIEAAERELTNFRENKKQALAEIAEREQALRDERKSRERELAEREKALQRERQTQQREFDRREAALRQEREAREREFARKESELEQQLAAARRTK